MSKKIRIGTRDSQLAIWQANHVSYLLKQQGLESELVPVKSEGDIDLNTPLYAMGVQGIFTRSLDLALLNNQIDLAVHSMKDVPVQLADGLEEAGVLERDSPFDLFVPNTRVGNFDMDLHQSAIIASSSLRRRAQWLHRFPSDQIEPIRGNVNTRLKKLKNSVWQGAIFAAAGLDRIGIRPLDAITLHWMIPAPAQGAILMVCRKSSTEILSYTEKISHPDTALCVQLERDFLTTLHGGCSTPIGALAEIQNEEIFFRGNLLDPDGKKILSVEKRISKTLAVNLGVTAAHEIMEMGGNEIFEKSEHV